MEVAAVIIVAVIVAATLGIWLLPRRKRWNEDGADDAARRQAVERDLGQDFPRPSLTREEAERQARKHRHLWPHGDKKE